MIASTRETAASRIAFGLGRLEGIDAEVGRPGADRVLLIGTVSGAATAALADVAPGGRPIPTGWPRC